MTALINSPHLILGFSIHVSNLSHTSVDSHVCSCTFGIHFCRMVTKDSSYISHIFANLTSRLVSFGSSSNSYDVASIKLSTSKPVEILPRIRRKVRVFVMGDVIIAEVAVIMASVIEGPSNLSGFGVFKSSTISVCYLYYLIAFDITTVERVKAHHSDYVFTVSPEGDGLTLDNMSNMPAILILLALCQNRVMDTLH